MGSTWQRQQEQGDREVRLVDEAGLVRTENTKGISTLHPWVYIKLGSFSMLAGCFP